MPGRLIAIEGIDGAGKGTQAKRLRDRFEADGNSVMLLSFPRYEETRFGGYIGEYLNGRFGALESVHPFLTSLLFAGDRLESRPHLLEALAGRDVVICDRYVGSNIAHQGARVPKGDRASLIDRIEEVEFQINALPRPDLTILLDASVPAARRLIARKGPRNYTEAAEDLHESNAEYLGAVREVYREVCARSSGWERVAVDGESGIRSIEEIAEEIWQIAHR